MFCSSRNLTLGINIAAALLLVTIINAYLLSQKFQIDAEKDLTEHYTKHIHVNPNKPSPNRPQSSGKPSSVISSNNPNPLNPNSNNPNQGGNHAGGGISKVENEKYPRDTCLPHHTTQRELLDLPLTIVTATSESYVGHVHNLIGSIHTHQPDVEVVVYNLGLDESTIKTLENYCGVTVHNFDFAKYPQHLKALKNFAWKALVVKQAVEDYGKILYLDSGYEVRQPLNFIRGRIEREGYFCTGMGDSLTRGGREGMFNFFKTSTLEYLGLPMTAGGVHGVTYWGGAYKGIILPASECSVDPGCITPDRTGDEVRSFGKDQPLFSNLVYRGGCTQCAMSPAFTAHASQAAEAGDPFTVGRQHLFHRRGSGPFNGRGKTRDTCPDRELVARKAWSKIRDRYNITFLGNNGCPHTRFSQKTDNELYALGDVQQSVFNVVESVRHTSLTIVTAAARDHFPKLENLVASANEWEPDRKVVVYDIGLSQDQVNQLQQGSNKVVVEKFDFNKYPSHIKEILSGAYLPVVLSMALNKYGSILYLSPTHILHQRLDTLIFQLERDGIFSPTIGGNVLDMFSSASSGARFFEKWPAVPEERRKDGDKLMEEFRYKPQCTASVLGFWKDSLASQLVLPPLKDCALDAVCWQSAESSISNKQRPEGLVLSLLIYDKICYTCNRDYDFYAYAGKKLSIVHAQKDFDLFSKSLIDEVQVLYDTKDDRR